ncbi:hypothetical protein [Legionella adelaidensis]|nr:hypothetical protein [Legionella adelaidensis]
MKRLLEMRHDSNVWLQYYREQIDTLKNLYNATILHIQGHRNRLEYWGISRTDQLLHAEDRYAYLFQQHRATRLKNITEKGLKAFIGGFGLFLLCITGISLIQSSLVLAAWSVLSISLISIEAYIWQPYRINSFSKELDKLLGKKTDSEYQVELTKLEFYFAIALELSTRLLHKHVDKDNAFFSGRGRVIGGKEIGKENYKDHRLLSVQSSSSYGLFQG